MSASDRIDLLRRLYGDVAERVAVQVEDLVTRHRRQAAAAAQWDETDAWLITYADQFREPHTPPLQTLRRFMTRHTPWLTGVHVLPFYPWSSDDGFSVTDYASVDPRYGTWDDIEALAAERRLVVDAVINHMSAQGEWFRRFLDGGAEFAGFFRTADPSADLGGVVRPRTTPLLTRFDGASGEHWVWTTFSADQVDLDYRNPRVLLRMLDVLLGYANHGAACLRLDAVGFLWKEEGTTSTHLPQTHWVIQLLRSCFDDTYSNVLLLTEVHLPHAENMAYFGDGTRSEAQLVYQFALPPLVLHAVGMKDASPLVRWVASLEPPPKGTTFVNFLASHDGVGVRAAEGLIAPEAIDALAERCRAARGEVGMRTLPNGLEAPYELNCTWFDLVGLGCDEDEAVARHLA
ncbi:MAG: alpha-amylase family glycosyl hydrolase, partial [Acidimicrobiia bacterium]